MNELVRWVVLLLGVHGCSAHEACTNDRYSDAPTAVAVSTAVAQGATTLTGPGETALVRFEATLSGLPELWDRDSAILSGTTEVHFSLAYESPPAGGAATEMPRVGVTVVPPSPPLEVTQVFVTSAYPPAGGDTARGGLITTCENGETTNCCPFGSRECTSDVLVRLERLDGSPFPPIVVDWSITAHARVSTCPLGYGDPSLSTFVEEP